MVLVDLLAVIGFLAIAVFAGGLIYEYAEGLNEEGADQDER